MSYDFLTNHDDASRNKIYSKIREVEEKLGNTVNSYYLFRITLADDSKDFKKKWVELFNPEQRKALNTIITKFILLENSFLSTKIREFRKNIKGLCLLFTNTIDLLKLHDKDDLDYLLSLAECNENELSNDNFTKFLNGELHLELLEETNEEKRKEKQKLIDAFSLVRYLVENAEILQVSNINVKKDSQFFLQYKEVLPKTDNYLNRRRITRSFDSKRIQIVLNRLQTKQVLKDLAEGHTINLKTNGHSVSITKICSNKDSIDNKKYHYIVIDSNGSQFVLCENSETRSAEDELCDVIEIVSNKHLGCSENTYISYQDATKVNKKVEKCLKEKDKDGKLYYEAKNIEFSSYKYQITQELIFAVQEGNSENVKNLLKRSAHINGVVEAKDDSNQTPIHFAAHYGHDEIIRSLLDNGAKINATNDEGKTALHFASICGYINYVSVLLGKGCDIEAKDNHLKTSLYCAVENDKTEMVEYLLENGTNINNQDFYDETVLDLARENCNLKMVRLLEKAAELRSNVRNAVAESFQQLSL